MKTNVEACIALEGVAFGLGLSGAVVRISTAG